MSAALISRLCGYTGVAACIVGGVLMLADLIHTITGLTVPLVPAGHLLTGGVLNLLGAVLLIAAMHLAPADNTPEDAA